MKTRSVLFACLCLAWPVGGWAADGASPSGQPAPATDVQGGGNLSDKLSTSGGVIHPEQNLDPTISKAPPPTGDTTPVIPPPGSPGGDPSVKPK